jgi:predicted Zn-dependent peptidase
MRARVLAAVPAALLLASAPSAQGPGAPAAPPTNAVVIKGRAPVSEETLRVKLPRPREADLPNGLHLMVLEDRRTPQVTFSLTIPGAGGYMDPDGLAGLASFTAALMREGTTTRTSVQLSEQLETMSATLNVGAGLSSTDASVNGSALTEHLDRLMEITADVLLNPVFAQTELALYKQRSRAGLIQQRSNPGFLVNELFARVMYGTHPASRISPTVEALDKVTRADIQAFHRARYVPDHAILAMAGDISLGEAQTLIAARLGGWKKAGVPAPQVQDPRPPGAAGVHVVSRANSVQTSFMVGTPAIKRTDADYDVVSVMNRVIGGGPTARLFLNLREEKGYTYGASSNLSASRFTGDWRASTDVRAEVTEPALKEILREVARLRDEAIAEKEFRDVKRSMVAVFALSLESPSQVLNYYVTSRQYGLPADHWDKYPDRIMAVTAAQVQAAAKKYLDASRLQIVAVAEPKITPLFQKYGTVVTYDTEGRRTGPQ